MSLNGILNWKVCKKCNRKFDIAINYNICPLCRIKEKRKIKKEGRDENNS